MIEGSEWRNNRAAMDVLNQLRPGLDEKLYERAMIIELKRRGHIFRSKKHSPFSIAVN
jgi:GxxExxY protein